MEKFNINEVAKQHSNWVEDMGWNNKNYLELLGLVGSEIGETIAEYKNNNITSKFSEELSDIILRIIHIAHISNIDLENLLKTTKIEWTTLAYPLLKDQLLELVVDWSQWMNTVRKDKPDEKFIPFMGTILSKIFFLAKKNNINLEEEIIKKMESNLSKGNRGRKV